MHVVLNSYVSILSSLFSPVAAVAARKTMPGACRRSVGQRSSRRRLSLLITSTFSSTIIASLLSVSSSAGLSPLLTSAFAFQHRHSTCVRILPSSTLLVHVRYRRQSRCMYKEYQPPSPPLLQLHTSPQSLQENGTANYDDDDDDDDDDRPPEPPAANGNNNKLFKQRSIILVSLPPKTDQAPSSVRRTWKWKDSALGGGRDYFVPRPRAISALNNLLVGTTIEVAESLASRRNDTSDTCNAHQQFVVEECGVLSNCARLDVVLVISGPNSGSGCVDASTEENMIDRTDASTSNSGGSMASRAAQKAVSEALAAQLVSYYGSSRKKNAALDGLAACLDLAGVVDENPPALSNNQDATELEGVLVTMEGSLDICSHLCRVASGMAERPSRPGREVPFRPFSSRDAHVMLQIKRTSEVANGARVKALFDASLQAGKAARDPKKVPEIISLRSFGTDGRYASEAPSRLTEAAVEAATRLAIDPATERCRSRLRAMDASESVSSLRTRVENDMLHMGINFDGDEGLIIRRLLHQACMALREGNDVKEDEVLQLIYGELGIFQKSQTST